MAYSNQEDMTILNKYKSSANKNLVEKFSKWIEINDKYQLTPGSEDDFNNAAKFLLYAQTKNSKAIDAAETDFSRYFGRVLENYYNRYVTVEELGQLCEYIYKYNLSIDVQFPELGSTDIPQKFVERILQFFGISVDSLPNIEIRDKSIAKTIIYENETVEEQSESEIIRKMIVLQILCSIITGNIPSYISSKFGENNTNWTTASNKYANIKTNIPGSIDNIMEEYRIFKESSKILVRFYIPDLKNIKDQKTSASDVEAYWAMNYANVNIMNFNNILFTSETELKYYKQIKTLFTYWAKGQSLSETDKGSYGFGEKNIDNKKAYCISLSIAYKELNPIIREIDCSDIQNIALYKCIEDFGYNTGKICSKIFNYSYNNTDESKMYVSDYVPGSLYTPDDRHVFFSVKTNDYIIRNSSVDDIVGYLSGDIIGFGSTEIQKMQISELLKLYSEVRTYFYKVLLNKAFILDDTYDIYKLLYIKAYTIERFITSRIKNTQDINKFTEEDCRNFLISYGLKILNDQIDNNNFINSTSYKKRVISEYTNLMAEKGSRAVIDRFFKIFNYDTVEIEIYKYLLYKEKDAQNKIAVKFLPVKYSTTNIANAIIANKDRAIPYDNFIAEDKYWTNTDLPETTIKSIFESPVTTKYMGIEMRKNVFSDFAKEKYLLSLCKYLEKNYIITTTENNKNDNLISKLTVNPAIFDSNIQITILDYYKLAALVFALYVYAREKVYSITKEDVEHISGSKFLGINSTATIHSISNTGTSNLLLKKPNSATNSLLEDLFTFTDNGKIYDYFSSEYTSSDYIDSDKYNTFKLLFSERAPNLSSGESDEGRFKNAYQKLETVFESLPYINIINKYTIDDPDHSDPAVTKNIITDLKYIYYKTKKETSSDSYDSTEFSLSNGNFYNYIFTKILKFPLAYLNGEYNPDTMLYTKDVVDTLDTIFTEFFTTSYSSDIGYFENTLNAGEISELISDYFSGISNNTEFTDRFDFIDRFITNYCADIISINTTDPIPTYKFTEGIDLAEAVSKLAESLTKIIIDINTILEAFENLKLTFQFAESVNNLFDFIKVAIKFFISYTSVLQTSQLIYMLDSKQEGIQISYRLEETLTNSLNDYMYYDEDIAIKEEEVNNANT